MNLPTLERELYTADGRKGWIATWHNHTSDDSFVAIDEPVSDRYVDETRCFISTSYGKGITTRRWTLKLKGFMKVEKDTKFEFGLTASGRAKVRVCPRHLVC